MTEGYISIMDMRKMDIRKGADFLRQNLIFYLTGILIILGIKYYYRQADCDSLLWILAPTTWWVELLSGIPFTYISGTGYVNHSLRLLIAPSCSGVRFMTITFATLAFSFVHIVALPRKGADSKSFQITCGNTASTGALGTKVRGFGWIAASALLSWLFTVFVNGLRIITAIYLPLYLEDAGLMTGILTPDRLHTMIGVVVYFIALLTIYRLVGYFIRRAKNSSYISQGNYGHSENVVGASSDTCKKYSLRTIVRKCAPPVFWYFALTLGFPFLNRASREGTAEFMEFAALVTGCCALVLLTYCIILSLRRQKENDGHL